MRTDWKIWQTSISLGCKQEDCRVTFAAKCAKIATLASAILTPSISHRNSVILVTFVENTARARLPWLVMSRYIIENK